MAVDPKPSIWNANDSQEVTAINYGLGDAGAYLLLEAGTEYHVWNDKGMVKGSSKMTCVRVSARDDNGDEVKNITKQHWPEIKSLTIHEGSNGGDASGETDDNMTEFQPVGLNAPLIIGDIPADCYRKIMVRVHIPNSGIEGPVTFQIYVLNQEPSTPIAKWTTGLHGNGVVYQSGGAFAVSIGSPASILDIEKGKALIDSLETYYGAAQEYDVSELDDGTYKLYLTSVGVISTIISTSSIPANSIELNRVVVAGGEATAVTDKRLFLTNIMVGLDEAKTTTPTKNQVYIATDTEKLYVCFADDTWSQVIPPSNFDFYNALADDHTWSGEKDTQLVGEDVAFGQLLYFNWTDKEWKLAKADVAATMPGLRIALESKADGETCLMLVKGYIRDDSAFEFAGAMVYVSEATAGAMTSTAPSTTGNQLQRVGQAKSADILFFDPSPDVGEI